MKFRKIGSPFPQQFQSIELLRGIAALMVCYFHFAWGNPHLLPGTNFIKQGAALGWSGVEIFFVISGFIIPYAMYKKKYELRNFFTFFKKRIIRIEPPYLISIVVVLVLGYVSTLSSKYRGAPFHLDWSNIAGHIIYLNAFTGKQWFCDAYWSLAIELQYYLFIAICFKLIVSENIYWRLLFFISFAASVMVPNTIPDFLFNYATFFIAGILLFQFVCKLINKTEFSILMISTLALLYYHNGVYMTLLVLATLLIIYFVEEVPPFFRKLGTISYSLYLIHIPIGGRVINFAEGRYTSVLVRECAVPLAFIVSILSAAAFYELFEKRFKSLSGAIKYAHKTDAGVTVQ